MTVAFARKRGYCPTVERSPVESATVADRRYSNWLTRFIWFTAAATLLLICSGGMVTSKGYGLAVPDWPTTFGYNMFMFPVSKWIGGILFEHTHRLIASTVGFLTIILSVWLWRSDDRAWMRLLGVIALGAVILQGILGGLRVTMLRDQIGVFHACLAQAFLALLVFIGLARSQTWQTLSHNQFALGSAVKIAIATTVAIYFQLALGATMRHQHRDLSILDFPTAYHSWIPDTSPAGLARINAQRDRQGLSDVTAFQIWLQIAHRFVALWIAAGVITTAAAVLRQSTLSTLRRLTTLWVVLLFVQITLGAWTIWSNKAADIATTHVALGATMLALGVSISAITLRLTRVTDRIMTPRLEAVPI
jgi:cytochrome c oxidase assembly protein subunit 15